jgi:hypothetical protein
MTASVVDTNVILVSNNKHEDVSDHCIAACAQRLQGIMKSGKLALDDSFLILGEYLRKTEPKTGNAPGDAFVKWALQNNANPQRVDLVSLLGHPIRGYENFPDDAELGDFDPADRKFVAVANTHSRKPPILQAADSKWVNWAEALGRHGLTVEFICKQDIARFYAKKFGS